MASQFRTLQCSLACNCSTDRFLEKQRKPEKQKLVRRYPGIAGIGILKSDLLVKQIFCLERDNTKTFRQAIADATVDHPELVVVLHGRKRQGIEEVTLLVGIGGIQAQKHPRTMEKTTSQPESMGFKCPEILGPEKRISPVEIFQEIFHAG